MIKIIKPGTRKNEVCERCGCEFSYEAEDIQSETVSPLEWGESVFKHPRYVECPQCNNKIYLEVTR